MARQQIIDNIENYLRVNKQARMDDLRKLHKNFYAIRDAIIQLEAEGKVEILDQEINGINRNRKYKIKLYKYKRS